MQFKVPQFLEIEDKIFGPFTFKQFVYLAGGAGICFVLYRTLGFALGAIPILVVGGFALLLAFYRPNSKPFIFMVEAGFKYFFQDKLYIWKKERGMTREMLEKKKAEAEIAPIAREARLSGSKLRDLAWSLDVLDLKKQ
ncbi:hypothetical protein A2933_00705 [Candidatus Nomurabacteria bacterium RIFCSPLOWO2_01_FULL_46_18]|uniref:PrgI family protein n=1 Tax=Candidatus Nomurabacteria bacterium RIFCSPLOWO2_01_FULL_46_18 TaxID=1801783 RepID=A0A1F6XEQ8_9BACT|nr:MAG: hypothetical protein A2933_00705 [Candidatus Nomurabacteria bacterium RIFCSPLOWO2_01_FULL_46_18]